MPSLHFYGISFVDFLLLFCTRFHYVLSPRALHSSSPRRLPSPPRLPRPPTPCLLLRLLPSQPKPQCPTLPLPNPPRYRHGHPPNKPKRLHDSLPHRFG